ncbi:MAG: hypothetical protein KC503_47375 [Myxococcales bacterium]|nr:hypothetical protein [Myxococcales bacterium]
MGETQQKEPSAEAAPSSEQTVRRWRKAFYSIYLAFTVLAGLWALLSMLSVHCGWRPPSAAAALRGPRIINKGDNPDELRRCHQRLERLLTDLHHKTFTLQARTLKYPKIDPAVEWRNWSKAWRARWRELDRRCRLSELAGSGKSKEIDRMQAIHRVLAELQLGYSGVVDRFVERFADRLRGLRKDLAAVRAMIDQRGARRR